MHRPEVGGGASHVAVWEKAPRGEQEHVPRPCGRRPCPGNRGRLVCPEQGAGVAAVKPEGKVRPWRPLDRLWPRRVPNTGWHNLLWEQTRRQGVRAKAGRPRQT